MLCRKGSVAPPRFYRKRPTHPIRLDTGVHGSEDIESASRNKRAGRSPSVQSQEGRRDSRAQRTVAAGRRRRHEGVITGTCAVMVRCSGRKHRNQTDARPIGQRSSRCDPDDAAGLARQVAQSNLLQGGSRGRRGGDWSLLRGLIPHLDQHLSDQLANRITVKSDIRILPTDPSNQRLARGGAARRAPPQHRFLHVHAPLPHPATIPRPDCAA